MVDVHSGRIVDYLMDGKDYFKQGRLIVGLRVREEVLNRETGVSSQDAWSKGLVRRRTNLIGSLRVVFLVMDVWWQILRIKQELFFC